MTLSYQLDVLNAGRIAAEYAKMNDPLSRLMASYGDLIAIPGSNQLVLRDTVANLKNVIHYLRTAEKAEKEKTAMLTHTCVYIRAREGKRRREQTEGTVGHGAAGDIHWRPRAKSGAGRPRDFR